MVTDGNLEYEGSVTIDASLMEMADIQEFEQVAIWDITNGARIETYAIRGMPNSGTICINGAAAHHVKKGDRVIIATYGEYSPEEARSHKPMVVLVNDVNKRVSNNPSSCKSSSS